MSTRTLRRPTVKRRLTTAEEEVENGENTALVVYSPSSILRNLKGVRHDNDTTSKKCCSCTRFSTCQTNKCECYAAGRSCSNCACFKQCKNLIEEGSDDENWNNYNSDDNNELDRVLTQAEFSEDGCCHRCSNITSCEYDDSQDDSGDEEALLTLPDFASDDELTESDSANDTTDAPNTSPPPSSHRDDDANTKIKAVYGDIIRQNDGTDIDGGVSDDQEWQSRWRKIIGLPTQHYTVPKGHIGRLFIQKLADEMNGIISRKWNAEKMIVFITVILQRSRDIKKSRDIRRRIERRLTEWSQGLFDMLLEDTVRTNLSLIKQKRNGMSDDEVAKQYTSLLLKGKVRQAVRFATERDKGGIFDRDDLDSKTGRPVFEVLKSKHPEAIILEGNHLEEYEHLPELVTLDITEDTVLEVTSKIRGAAGPGGVDSLTLQHWLLRFGKESKNLREAVASMTRLLSNESPSWASYRALISNHLVALDKCPGVRPVGIGESWRRLMAKCVLAVGGESVKNACGSTQLCGGLEAAIEGAVHTLNEAWMEKEEEDDWGVLLVDARNAFNEGNRMRMLWTVRHRWPEGARFAFNCYRHWSILCVRARDGSAPGLLHSKEGVTQGDPFSMALYGILLLPLSKLLKEKEKDLLQVWYADDAKATGNFDKITNYFKILCEEGPKYGYFPEPTKSILITSNKNQASAKEKFSQQGFKITNGARYRGGFVGVQEKKDEWIREQVEDWRKGVQALAKIAHSQPHSAFVGLQQSLQSEWTHLQRVCPDIESHFDPLESAIHQDFLPKLMGTTELSPPTLRSLLALPTKLAGVGIPKPTTTSANNYSSSTLGTELITQSLREHTPLCLASHHKHISTSRYSSRADNFSESEEILEDLMTAMNPSQKRKVERAKATGSWLSVTPTFINGLSLSKGEFRDGLSLRYGLEIKDLPKKCDGCNAKFSVNHALSCKKGGLVVNRHNEVKDEVAYLAALATSPGKVRDKPNIHISRTSSEANLPGHASTKGTSPSPSYNNNSNTNTDEQQRFFERGDILIHGLFEKQTSCILDVRVTDSDCPSNLLASPEKVLARHEREKKKKYLEACLEERRHFSPYVCDCYGLLGEEAKAVNKKLAAKLASKWKAPYSATCGFINARVSIAILRATHLCLRGSCVPYRNASTKWAQWDDGAGLLLPH